MRWSYGVTTVLKRRADLLPRTLQSLKRAGFDRPRLFVDGCSSGDAAMYEQTFGLEVTARCPAVRAYGNWILSLAELYLRDPAADRYAVFQDDFVTYLGLRGYLEHEPYPRLGYLNLYTYRQNEVVIQGKPYGWHQAFSSHDYGSSSNGIPNQGGKGAIVLVFNRPAVQVLLRSQHMVDHPTDTMRGWRSVDGAVVSAMNKAGWREYVHNPSLVQHTGRVSTTGTGIHAQARSFLGEGHNAESFLCPEAQDSSAAGQKANPQAASSASQGTQGQEYWREELARCLHFLYIDGQRLAGARNPAEKRTLSMALAQGKIRVENVRRQLALAESKG